MLKSEAKTSLVAGCSKAHKPMTFMLAAGELTKIKTESTYFVKNFPRVSIISGSSCHAHVCSSVTISEQFCQKTLSGQSMEEKI